MVIAHPQCCQVYDFIRTFTEFTVFVRSTENDCKCTEVPPFSFIILLVIKGKGSTALEVKALLQASTMDDSSTSAEGPVPQGPECPAPKRKCFQGGECLKTHGSYQKELAAVPRVQNMLFVSIAVAIFALLMVDSMM